MSPLILILGTVGGFLLWWFEPDIRAAPRKFRTFFWAHYLMWRANRILARMERSARRRRQIQIDTK